jgi:N4-gp56 family major capsid protein
MAQTYAATGLTPQQWDDEFFVDYVRSSRYKRYMGTDEAAIFQVKDDLTKKKGDSLTFALVNELVGNGVTGNATLMGSEERLGSRSFRLAVDVLRHAVAVDDWDDQKSAIDLRNASRAQLRQWASKKFRDACTTALGMIDGVAYASATTANKNTWNANNQDRVLYGNSTANFNATHATALANVDNTNDKCSALTLSLMKRMGQSASPKIGPTMVKEMDQEWFVVFVGPRSWRNLTEDNPTTNILTLANRDARVRGTDNPLFTGDSLVWDGMILREIPEIAPITGVGAAGIDVEPVYLCGQQAIGIAWAQRTKSTTQVIDYDFLHGCGVQEIRGIEKLRYGTSASADTTTPKDHGIVTGFFAAVAD